jgi:hypothetical protein
MFKTKWYLRQIQIIFSGGLTMAIVMITALLVFIIGISPEIFNHPRKTYRIVYGLYANSSAFVTARSPQKAVAKFYRKYGRGWEIRKIEEMDW